MENTENKYENFQDYCQKLSKWVNEQRANIYSQYMSSQTLMMLNHNFNSYKTTELKSETKPPTNFSNQQNLNTNNQNTNAHPNLDGDNENDSDDMPIQGQRYSLPHPLRRMFAEFIDYLLLMIIKIGIIFLLQGKLSLGEIAETIDFDFRYIINKHKLGTVDNNNQYSSSNLVGNEPDQGLARSALNPFEVITMEIVFAEIINRVVITLYEALWLSGMIYQISATPGKLLTGLRVVACKDLFDLPLNRVEVLPGTLPGFASALIRSLIKNFAMVFFLPLCMTALIFSHHRTSYDLIAGTIVVKVPPPRQRRLNLAGQAARNPPQ